MIFSDYNFDILNSKAKDMVVVLPLGAIEQHGPHLPVSTDYDIVGRLALEVEKKLSEDILLCPVLPFGSSHHHLSFGGTISVSIPTYTTVIIEIIESLLSGGFRRIVLLNGHGGNIIPVKQALAILSNKYDQLLSPNIVLATYWELSGKIFLGAPPMESPSLSHACEYETSLMLYLHEGKVLEDHIKRGKRPASNGFVAWEDDEPYRGVTMLKQTQFISDTGSSGEPQLASREKGQHLFEHALQALVQFLSSFKTWPYLENLSK